MDIPAWMAGVLSVLCLAPRSRSLKLAEHIRCYGVRAWGIHGFAEYPCGHRHRILLDAAGLARNRPSIPGLILAANVESCGGFGTMLPGRISVEFRSVRYC